MAPKNNQKAKRAAKGAALSIALVSATALATRKNDRLKQLVSTVKSLSKAPPLEKFQTSYMKAGGVGKLTSAQLLVTHLFSGSIVGSYKVKAQTLSYYFLMINGVLKGLSVLYGESAVLVTIPWTIIEGKRLKAEVNMGFDVTSGWSFGQSAEYEEHSVWAKAGNWLANQIGASDPIDTTASLDLSIVLKKFYVPLFINHTGDEPLISVQFEGFSRTTGGTVSVTYPKYFTSFPIDYDSTVEEFVVEKTQSGEWQVKMNDVPIQGVDVHVNVSHTSTVTVTGVDKQQ